MELGPIFVAGIERSGTSLAYALLASHPNIAMTRRTNLWTHFYGQYGNLGDDENLDRCLEKMRRYKRLVILDLDYERLRRNFRAGDPTYPRLFALIEQQCAERLGRPRWGDKSLGTERYAEEILKAYPGTRILHMIRDPRDRFASSLTRWGVRRGGVGAGTAEWVASARLASAHSQRHRDQYRVVRYESLVAEPRATLHEICRFLGEDFDDAMLEMDGAPRFRDTGSNSSYERRQAGDISTRSIGRYRDVLSLRQVRFIDLAARDEMARFGYEPDPRHSDLSDNLRFAVGVVPLESARWAAWRCRETLRNRRGRPVPSYRLVARAGAS